MTSSALFNSYRHVGLVCGGTGTQSSLYGLGEDVFFATPIGRAYQVYNCDHLTVCMVSRLIPSTISHLACFREWTFAATDDGVVVFDRGRPLRTLPWYATTSTSAPATAAAAASACVALMTLGEYLLSLAASGVVRVWRIPAITAGIGAARGAAASDADASESDTAPQHVHVVLQLPPGVHASALLHPDTYVNKVAIGASNGSVYIVNLQSGKLIHECVVARGAAITCMAQSDTLDVIGVGTSDGRVVVHNLRVDAPVCTLQHSGADTKLAAGAVTVVAFSRNSSLPHPTLLSGTESGSLALWNLESKMLQMLLPAAHGSAIVHASWLPRQPCFITAGDDNALHIWMVDKFDGMPRHLRSRSGHAAPPRIIRYYGGTAVASLASGANASACEIASAGADRALRLVHTALDRQNTELSQGSLQARAKEMGVHPNALRLPTIVALAVSDRRFAQWSDVVTAHAGDSRAYLWTWESKRLDSHVLPLSDERESVTAVTISACGHSAVLGGSFGTLQQFNLQSGARRGAFPSAPGGDGPLRVHGKRRRETHEMELGRVDRDTGKGTVGDGSRLGMVDSIDTALFKVMGMAPPRRGPNAPAGSAPAVVSPHAGHAIVGLAVNGMNAIMAAVDARGVVSFWEFATHALRGTCTLPAGASSAACHREAGLFAVACDDFSVRVADMTSSRVVRTYSGHTNRITDACFSTDARWLITSSLDRTVRVWDLPTARCIDWMVFETAPTSVTFAPTSEYLVTAHVDQLGLCLWANKAHFGGAIIEELPRAPYRMSTPSVSVETEGTASVPVGEGEVAAAVPPADGSHGGRKRARAASDVTPAVAPAQEDAPAESKIVLSGVSTTVWQNLTRLDIIAARNKPLEAPKKPADAPFFLPTTGGLKPTFVVPTPDDTSAAGAADGKQAGSRIRKSMKRTGDEDEDDDDAVSGRVPTSTLARLLLEMQVAAGPSDASVHAVRDHLKSLPTSGVDAEVRSLCLGEEDEQGIAALHALLHFIQLTLSTGQDFDLTHAYLQLALQVYQDIIAAVPDMQPVLAKLHSHTSTGSAGVNDVLERCLCMISSFLGQA